MDNLANIRDRWLNTTHNKLTIVDVEKASPHYIALCRCECGKNTKSRLTCVVNGRTKSCGCLKVNNRPELITRHGHTKGYSKTKVYRTWLKMLERAAPHHKCKNTYTNTKYRDRGIGVCTRWLTFENFLEDMEEKPDWAHSIERINNEGSYEPSNCRWATAAEQARNTRNTRYITYKGVTLCLTDWAIRIGVKRQTLFSRLQVKSVEEVLGCCYV